MAGSAAATLERVLRAVEERHGLDLQPVGRLPGGEVGAHEARDAAGTRYVVKWWPGGGSYLRVRRAADLVERLRAVGYPAPRYVLVERTDELTLMVQEHLPGRPAPTVDEPLVDALAALVERQAGLGDGGPEWGATIVESLVQGCRGYCEHESLERHDPRTAALLDRIRRVGRETDPASLPAHDVVHFDFHPGNVLVRDGRVAGVIDWEGCRCGDRAFDLVTLAFVLELRQVQASLRRRVWALATAAAAAPARRAYLAHVVLREVDWSLRNHGPDELERRLAAVARCGLG